LEVVASLLTRDEVAELELQEEEARSRELGLEFHVFPIPDRGVPDPRDKTADLLKVLGAALESGKDVAVHCRQGIGRSAVIAAALLVSAGEAPDEAFRSIASARGTAVPETAAQREWLAEFARETPAASVHPR
jgi:protein-tyrosine phosphatase